MKASTPFPWIAGFLLTTLATVDARPGPAGTRAPDVPRLVMASYRYDFQGDARKPGGVVGVRLAGGASALTHHPWEGEGPWFSGERAAWHRSQLALMQGAGIDVALPVYGGAAGNRAGRGMAALVQALKELRAQPGALPGRQEFPQLALAVDLAALARQPGGSVDLKDAATQRALYGRLRDAALRVPPEFRATVQLPQKRDEGTLLASAPAGAACIVRLTGGEAVRDLDDSCTTYCEQRFAREFGCGLAWVGTPALRAKAPGLAAYASPAGSRGPARTEAGGLLATASLGPGFENALVGGDGSARSRANGSSYISDWRVTLEARPDWIFLDSWNDFAQGSELAPSLEYGLQFRDLTRGATMQFTAGPAALPIAGTVLRATAPRQVEPGTLTAVEATVKNEGTTDWHAFAPVSLSYRWLRDGEPVSDISPATPLTQGQGEIRTYPLPIAPPMRGGKLLPPGRYDLEIGLVRRGADGEAWLDAAAQTPFRTSVQVAPAPALRPYWVRSTMPAAARAGLTYRATVTLRNDGSAPWRPESGAALGFRWRRVSVDRDDVLAEAVKIPLSEPVAPGRLLTTTVDVPLVDPQDRPLPLSSANQDGHTVLEWDVWDGSQWSSAAGVPGLREAVEVVDRDPGANFLGCNLPAELVAGRTQAVTLAVHNVGPETWKAERDEIAVQWYAMDGTEIPGADTRLPLPVTVAPYSEVTVRVPARGSAAKRSGAKDAQPLAADTPGERVEKVVRDTILRGVPVRVPPYSGPLYCVFDLIHDGQPASTAASPASDLLVVPVNVYSPATMPLPLTPFFDTDGISSDLNRADGNLDGRGNTLPAEQLPPYVSRPAVGTGPSASPITPCGLWLRALGPDAADRMTFLYPPKEDRARNMVACRGQRLPVLAAPRAAVHLLALATEENVTAPFQLLYEDGTTETRSLTLTHFTDPPAHGEHGAFVIAHRHTPTGDDLQSRCHLNHYVLPANPRRSLAAVELPKNAAVKIMAVTLESPSEAGRGSAGP